MAMATGSPGKQLFFIGDSQPNRMWNCELFHMHEVHNWTEPGAETRQVLELVRKRVQKSEIKFRNDSIGIIWVGTNDVLHNTDSDFNDSFKRLVTYVKRLYSQKFSSFKFLLSWPNHPKLKKSKQWTNTFHPSKIRTRYEFSIYFNLFLKMEKFR